MGIDSEPSSIESKLEGFAEDLDAAGECASAFGARTTLQDLPSFEGLLGHEEAMLRKLTQHFGIEPSTPEIAREYTMDGTPGTSGEGTINVRVIRTNDPQIFLGEYKYADGDVVWAIRPLEGDE
jgi:hypothetical protein